MSLFIYTFKQNLPIEDEKNRYQVEENVQKNIRFYEGTKYDTIYNTIKYD